eukprot:COSAG01_NODE_175_length_22996_cov_18.857892_7_plen_95_part_00
MTEPQLTPFDPSVALLPGTCKFRLKGGRESLPGIQAKVLPIQPHDSCAYKGAVSKMKNEASCLHLLRSRAKATSLGNMRSARVTSDLPSIPMVR